MDREDPITQDGLQDEPIEELEAETEILESVLETKDEEEVVSPEERSQLAKLDPVRKYLLDISKFEPLTAEEEHRLALLYREEGNQQAAYRLVTSNLKLVSE